MPQIVQLLSVPTDPDPQEWLTVERMTLLHNQISTSSNILRLSGLIPSILAYWVRLQVSLEIETLPQQYEDVLQQRLSRWHEQHSLDRMYITEEELRLKLRVPIAASLWCRSQWGHMLENVYLEQKSNLDQCSCRVLRHNDKDLITEIYHRIKAGETSFDAAAREFGQGAERTQGGYLPFQPLAKMPLGLGTLLDRLNPGQLSTPLKLKSGYCLVQLEKLKRCQFNGDTQEHLLAMMFERWIESVVEAITYVLRSSNQFSSNLSFEQHA